MQACAYPLQESLTHEVVDVIFNKGQSMQCRATLTNRKAHTEAFTPVTKPSPHLDLTHANDQLAVATA